MSARQSIIASLIRLLVMTITVIAVLVFWQASQFSGEQYIGFKQAIKAQQVTKKLNTNYLQVVSQYQGYKFLNTQRAKLSEELSLSGFQKSKWVIRDLKVQGAAVPREKIPDYLMGASNQPGYLFIPSQFELRVPYAEDDIFTWVTGDSKTLRLTLNGQYYIRREQ